MPKLPKNFILTPAASADEPTEISIRGYIGDSWDMDEYTMTNTEEEIINALSDIPKGNKINLRINSVGGNVAYAFGIYNALKRRAGDVTTYNEGTACSSAAVLMCAGARSIMPASSVFMIHCASNEAYGNAADMAKNIEMLNAFDKSIAGVFAAKTGKKSEDILKMMQDETWMTGDEAKQNGFADESNDDSPVFNCAGDLQRFKKLPKNLRSRLVTASAGGTSATKPQIENDTHDMKKIITAMVALGMTVAADATEDQLITVLNSGYNGLKTERDGQKTAIEGHVTAQKTRVTNRVQAAIEAKKIKAERKEALIAMGVTNEANLDFLDDINVTTTPAKPAQRGAAPAPVENNEQKGEVEAEIQSLRESARTEKDPLKVSANAKRLRELRGHKDLFATAKN